MLIFDLDGTLIDSAGDLHRSVNVLLAEHSLEPLSLPDVRAMVGDGVTQLVTRVFAARDVQPPDIAKEVQRYLEIYGADPVVLTELYAGVRETLDVFTERGIPMTISTNKPERLSLEVLKRLDLLHYFKAVVGGDTNSFRKPDPRMLTHLLERFGADPASAWMIGDSEVDAAAAEGAKVRFILMTYGYRRAPIESIRHHLALGQFSGLVNAVTV
jgi:phosphoglycolate phosphatase